MAWANRFTNGRPIKRATHSSPQLKHETTSLGGTSLPQSFVVGFVNLSQVTLVVAAVRAPAHPRQLRPEGGPHLSQELSSLCDGRPFDHNRHWPTAVPLSVWRAGSPSNTMWPGPRPTSLPSGILIHPTVWPQYTNYVTDRQKGETDRTDRQHIQDNGPAA